ncbi:phycobilisome rod-core linker polypeptide [Aetokthonos hydrillicola Thurmond2011]|jgi:phycocyanin-associated rod linker protein|uniref:Phycobilisome rod-core linker polypeptide n=2 Tax=Aetokthonos TaxID=1550243 RepID=A0AAP5I6G3_9CYAN|nr:phycobilisome rod-core linker polypeptide [Aetokthonos hydrillicola]MBO3461253.1 photosystem I reaction center subunit XII [Aetokthonos hydrillicola CCALA 1050]MBW4583700.1 phycobilisome rod-core linker polypeptide [Aetokthonos hydrillicola CCALA 1050]MDR9895604.1 phycobilisome rod-core linker polypeptide [Aetokthonos hydrillicola Thurmond2011]
MAITTAASRLGTSAFDETAPLELRAQATKEEIALVISAVYRHLLGNDYLLQSERLTTAESLLTDRKITVQEFVRQVAKSELYKSKFFYNNFQTRVIELNYKHLLGRAPYDESEVVYHLDLYQNKGYDADIDSYIDSPEYQASFGENIVPYYRGFETQKGQKTVGFSRIFKLYRGYANSDRAQLQGNYSHLAEELARNSASTVVSPSGSNDGFAYLPSRKGVTPSTGFGGGAAYGKEGRLFRVEVAGGVGRGYPKVRRTNQAVVIPYEELSPYFQSVLKQGGKIASVTPL